MSDQVNDQVGDQVNDQVSRIKRLKRNDFEVDRKRIESE